MIKLLCVFICVGVLAGYALAAPKFEYGLMIDAGSSGSRIYIYQWPFRTADTVPDLNTSPLNQTQWSLKVSPGLSTYYDKLDQIPTYLSQLIDYGRRNLDSSLWAGTFLYLKATGGLRALAQSDQDNIMRETKKYLQTTPFNFTSDYATVISLDQEATYGWLAVNYLAKTLTDPTHTVGALDMGGATTEISYVPDETPKAHRIPLTLTGKQYNVYAGGYAARGLDTALILLNNAAISEQDDGSGMVVINQPCFLQGYTLPVFYNGMSYNVSGTSDYSACLALVQRALLNTSVPCEVDPCRFNGVYQPPLINRQYYAFSGFAYTYNFYFAGNPGDHTIKQFADQGVAYCALTFSGSQVQYPSEAASRLANYCFTGTYLSALLNTYGFTDGTVVKFGTVVNGLEVSWAVGAMLYEANLLPYYPNPTPNPSNTGVRTAPAPSTSWMMMCAFVLLYVCMYSLMH